MLEKIKENILNIAIIVLIISLSLYSVYKFKITGHKFSIRTEILPALVKDLALPLSNYTDENVKNFMPASKEPISDWCKQHRISKSFCETCAANLLPTDKDENFVLSCCYISNSIQDLSDLGRRLPKNPVILAIVIKANKNSKTKTMFICTKYHKDVISYPLVYCIP